MYTHNNCSSSTNSIFSSAFLPTLNHPKPISIYQWNCAETLLALLKLHPHLPIQDLFTSFANMILSLPGSTEKILQNLLVNPRHDHFGFYDPYYSYIPPIYPFHSPMDGPWRTKDSLLAGNNLFSLAMAIRGGSDIDSVLFVANILGVDLFKKDVIQSEELNGFKFVRNGSTYPATIFNSNFVFNLLGKPDLEFKFPNDNGLHSFSLLVWRTKYGPIRLFLTKQVNLLTGEMILEFVTPPPEFMILNNSQISSKSNPCTIVIYDDLMLAFSSHQQSIIPTWSGDLPNASKLPWTIPKWKRVIFEFNHRNEHSCRIGAILHEKFSKLGIPLRFRPTFNQSFQEQPFEVDQSGEISADTFYKFVKSHHGLDLQQEAVHTQSIARTIDDTSETEEPQYIILPFLSKGQWMNFTASQKVGKSLVALDICLLVASGASFGNRLSAPKALKVLLVDSEMPNATIAERAKKLKKANYSNHDDISNFRYISLHSLGKKIDLTNKDDQEWLEQQLGDAKLLALDNLGGITSHAVERNEERWQQLSRLIRRLNRKGITVLLIHHENKTGVHRGTGKITDDTDLNVSLRRPQNASYDKTLIEFHIVDSRYLHGEQRRPFLIEYVEEDGGIKRIVHSLDNDLENLPESLVAQEEIYVNKLTDLEVLIMEKVRHPQTNHVTAGDFKDDEQKGRSASTVTMHLSKLCSLNLLEKQGEGSGTKYFAVKK